MASIGEMLLSGAKLLATIIIAPFVLGLHYIWKYTFGLFQKTE